jgi:hypothetical protein
MANLWIKKQDNPLLPSQRSNIRLLPFFIHELDRGETIAPDENFGTASGRFSRSWSFRLFLFLFRLGFFLDSLFSSFGFGGNLDFYCARL